MAQIAREMQIRSLRDHAPVVVFSDLRQSLGHPAIARRLLRRRADGTEADAQRKHAKEPRAHRYGCTTKLNIIA